MSQKTQDNGQAIGPRAPSAGDQARQICRRPAVRRDPLSRVQADPQAQSLHLAAEPVRLRQGAAPAGQDDRRAFRSRDLHRAAARHPRGAVRRYPRLPAVQQRLHPAPPHPLPGRLPDRRAGDRLQVPPHRPAEDGRDRHAAAHQRRLPHQVQGRGPAAQGRAGRHAHALLAQCRVPSRERDHERPHVDGAHRPGAAGAAVDPVGEGRARRAGRRHHRRGSAAGHRRARFRQPHARRCATSRCGAIAATTRR